MPIVDLGSDHVDQACACCGVTRRISTPSSTVDTTFAQATEDPYVLALPPCTACGAREFLIRSRAVSGAPPSQHLELVNQFFEQLEKRRGRKVAAEAS